MSIKIVSGGYKVWSATLALAIGFAFAAPAAAQVDGVSYTLKPSYTFVQWDDELGLSDTELFGGRLGLNFGRYLALEGYYLGRNGVETDIERTGLPGLNGLMNQEVDIESFGADLVLSPRSGGPVTPFIKTGGGILRFTNAADQDFEQINLKIGGGVRFGIDRFTAEVFVEDSAFRLDRYAFAAGDNLPAMEDPEANDIRHNLMVGVGVNFNLGGYDRDELTPTDRALVERYRAGLRGLSIPIEPYVGRLEFSDRLGIDSQEVLGVRAGVDLGPYVGLRGYWWHGVSDDFDRTDPIQSFGGEAQFNLSSGQGAVPFLIAGVGQIDFKEGYFGAGSDSTKISDKTALVLGGGLAFNLSDRLRMQVSARDYLFSEANDDEVRGTDDVFGNLMLSAGFRFSFGGPSGSAPMPARPDVSPVIPGAGVISEDAQVAPEAPALTDTPAPVGEVAATPAPPVVEAPAATLLPSRTLAGERIIPIPVPALGEIYVRYGAPGGVSITSQGLATPVPGPAAVAPAPETRAAPEPLDRDAIRLLLRDELDRMQKDRDQTRVEPPAVKAEEPVTMAQIEDMERRIADTLGDKMERVLKDELSYRRDLERDPTRVVITDDRESGEVQVESGDAVRVAPSEPYHWKLKEIRPYTGLNADSPEQFLLGVRGNLGPVTRGSKFQLVPELALGFGSGGTSYLVAGNLRYDFGGIGPQGSFSPYALVGAGLFGFSGDEVGRASSEGVVNLGYGVTTRIGSTVAFIEHQGIDLFNLHRILTGLRFNW